MTSDVGLKEGDAGTEFDLHADNYDAELEESLSVSGEDKIYFARGRIEWLSRVLPSRRDDIKSVLDFGCGTGTSIPFFFERLGAERVVGIDVSVKSLEVARRVHGSSRAQFLTFQEYEPNGEIDLVFCNGVFHHIPLAERAAAVSYIHRALRPGGLFALWENNPWNPGTRYVMSKCPFDQDAQTLTPPEARGLACQGGFKVLRTDFLFIFPHLLRWLRGLEPHVSGLPLGAQYQVLGRKP